MDIINDAKQWFQVESAKDLVSVRAIVHNQPFSGYVGWVGYGNLGDEAVYKAVQVLFPDQNFQVFRTALPAKIAAAFYHRKLPLDIFALGGGTLINQSPLWFDEAQSAIKNGVPAFCIGTGVAPSKSADSPPDAEHDLMKRWAKLLPEFSYVGVRGPMSKEYLKQAGYKAEVVGDTALALAPEKYLPRSLGKKIGINVSYGTDGIMHGKPDKFIQEVKLAVLSLLEQGFEVTIFPIWPGDLAASEMLLKDIAKPEVRLEKAYETVEKYISAIGECDVFIGQKLHATIFSTMLRIPSIMLEYRPKCLDYMKSINMEEFCVRTDRINGTKLVELVNKIMTRHESIRETLDKEILFYKHLQFKRAKEIKLNLV